MREMKEKTLRLFFLNVLFGTSVICLDLPLEPIELWLSIVFYRFEYNTIIYVLDF